MSIFEEAINYLSRGHDISDETDSRGKVNARNGRCILSSGIEYSFVNLLCNQIYECYPVINRPKFHELFYIPNLRAEAIVGYDLSIGLFSQNNRVRTMNKVINGQWCDQPWEFELITQHKKNRPHDFTGDFDHFVRLSSSQDNILPFLFLNICFCIHDFRRMGADLENFNIPSYDSLLRTVIIDLHALDLQLRQNRINYHEDVFSLKIRKTISQRQVNEEGAGEEISNYISRISQVDTFQIRANGTLLENNGLVITLESFQDRLIHHLIPLNQ